MNCEYWKYFSPFLWMYSFEVILVHKLNERQENRNLTIEWKVVVCLSSELRKGLSETSIRQWEYVWIFVLPKKKKQFMETFCTFNVNILQAAVVYTQGVCMFMLNEFGICSQLQ